MEKILEEVLIDISKKNPLHGKKLREGFSRGGQTFLNSSEELLERIVGYLSKRKKNILYIVDCYLDLCNEMMHEQIHFRKTGRYSCDSFEDANRKVYSNPQKMQAYMDGLLLSQVLWRHHYDVYRYFVDNLADNAGAVVNYLEIGAGHGMYLDESLRILGSEVHFTVVDISPKSIELAKEFVSTSRVEYVQSDIYEYDSFKKYNFIVMGEVLEHVEQPLRLLRRVHLLLSAGGRAFITVPINAPAVDHIYLFNNCGEVEEMLNSAGFKILGSVVSVSEFMDVAEAEKKKVPIIYAAFIQRDG